MALHNIERCRDGCRTSLLIAGVVLVPAIFHTLLPPCHPYITIHFMEMIFSTCSTNFFDTFVPHIIKGSLYCIMHANTNPVFMVHLTETSQLTDDVSCVHTWYIEHTYLSICFLQNNHKL